MKIVAIVQARVGSTRLPGKVLKRLVKKSVIEILLARLSRSEFISEVCVATSKKRENDILSTEVQRLGYNVFRGSEKNVLQRFYKAAEATSAEVIVRITGDCPAIDPKVVDSVINLFFKHEVDYASNINPPTFPDGLDVEVFTMNALKKAHREANQDRAKRRTQG